MKEVVRKEVLKWLDAGVIYPISDSAWVSPIQVVLKKGGTTVIKTENNTLLPSRTVTGWRICIDYLKLNKATRKDHFPLPTRTNDASVVAKFLRSHIFTLFGTPRALITDGGTHFCNKMVERVLKKYGVWHHTSLAYHPQENVQAEVSKREIKSILEKTVNSSRKDWSKKIEDALWAYMTTFKTPLGMLPFRIIYGKACHLSVELEHRAYWATRMLNIDSKIAGEKRML